MRARARLSSRGNNNNNNNNIISLLPLRDENVEGNRRRPRTANRISLRFLRSVWSAQRVGSVDGFSTQLMR